MPELTQLSYKEARDAINKHIYKIDSTVEEIEIIKNSFVQNSGRDTAIRIYRPKLEEKLPSMLLIHGGAWVAGSIDTHDNLARYISKYTNSVVVSVDYKNSPEAKYDYIIEQCYDALVWLDSNRVELNITNYTSVVGDSAGGNIGAVLALMSVDRDGPTINNLALINPAPDLRYPGEVVGDGTGEDFMRWEAQLYTSKYEETLHEYVSPTISKKLKSFPPSLIVLAENDFLFKDGYDFAIKLKEQGVPTEIYIQKNIGHLAGEGARASNKALPSLKEVVSYISKHIINE